MEEEVVFIPYNQNMDYLIMEFHSLKRDEETKALDIMMVRYKDKLYPLHYDYRYEYYVGNVTHNNKQVKGYVV